MLRTALFLALLLFVPLSGKAAVSAGAKVLIINSYHMGYLWSDGEVYGIENTIKKALPDAYVVVEYMDTKRVPPETSFSTLFSLYRAKYEKWDFDLIVAVDDNAFSFLKRFRNQLFRGAPVVFCGVNNFKPEMLEGFKKATGVTEVHRVADNLALIQRLHPGLKKVTVVTDVTVSGQISLQKVKDAISVFSGHLEFEFVEGLPLPELESHLSRLPRDTVVFLLNYFRDCAGNYYSPETVMPRISQASTVPVYCFSEFYLNHGVTGGIINEGYAHGTLTGKIALRVLAGEDPATMPVIPGPMKPVFDYRQMVRFGLSIASLPGDAIILNHKEGGQKDVLILHSYDPEFSWTINMARGLKEVLRKRGDIGEIFVEYMDTKRFFNKMYVHQLFELFRYKYGNRTLDLVISTDDNAFDFLREFRTILFKDTPVVFCGVNHLSHQESPHQENMTGVLESFDLQGSVAAILRIDPQVNTILLINDHTTTGLKMQRRIEELLPRIKEPVAFRFVPAMGMKELLAELSTLDRRTAVLFLNYYVDGNNVRYSIEKSLRAITSACNRPVFSLSEYTLGLGVVGGSVAYSYDQGTLAAHLGSRILDGEKASQIPLIRSHPFRTFFDHEVLERFGIAAHLLPEGSIVINAPRGFWREHRWKAVFLGTVFLLLCGGICLQQHRIRRNERRVAEMQKDARIDHLTGTIVRKYFQPEVEEMMETARLAGEPLVLCYGDVNDLKYVNDTFGHKEGDNYLVTMVNLIREAIRSSDKIYRMGGDEFMIVFYGCDKRHAEERLHQIRQKITRLNLSPEYRYPQGMCFGCAVYDPSSPQTLEQLMEEADNNMYFEKDESGLASQPPIV